jgi:TRAP-type mannitol/chloroaromatic compound transport system permease small subunit
MMLRLADSLDGSPRHGERVRWLALIMVLVQFGIVVGRYVFGSIHRRAGKRALHACDAVHAWRGLHAAGRQACPRRRVLCQGSDPDPARIDIFGHLFLLIPSMLALLYWSWPSVRNSWKILEGPISVGGIEAVFLLKSLIPAFCILLLQSLSLLIRLLLPETSRPEAKA